MRPEEKVPEVVKFFDITARIHHLNEAFRVRARIRYLYEVLCFILIIFDAFFLFLTTILNLKTGTLAGIATFDAFVVVFLWVEYLLRVDAEENKGRYIASQWSDLLAIIPFDYFALVAFGATMPAGLIFRLLRLVRVVALLRFSRRIEKEVLAFAEKTRLIYGLAIYLLVIIVGTTVFFNWESGVNPNVGSPDDALWYMIVTMTSVGYGDVVPYTGIGRIIGVIAMLSAILFASLVTATTTSALLEKFRAEREDLTKSSKETIGHVLARLTAIENRLDDSTGEIKAELAELKGIRADIESLKESVNTKEGGD